MPDRTQPLLERGVRKTPTLHREAVGGQSSFWSNPFCTAEEMRVARDIATQINIPGVID